MDDARLLENLLSGTIFDPAPSAAAAPFAGTIFETTPGPTLGSDAPAGGIAGFESWLRHLLEN